MDQRVESRAGDGFSDPAGETCPRAKRAAVGDGVWAYPCEAMDGSSEQWLLWMLGFRAEGSWGMMCLVWVCLNPGEKGTKGKAFKIIM